MLPGFRLVCATVVLAISFVVFGLGAAALLRASHDQFTNLPLAQTPREPLPVRDAEQRQATLALLRVEMMATQAQTQTQAEDAPRAPADAAESVAVVPDAPVPEASAAPPSAAAPEPFAAVKSDDSSAHDAPTASDPSPSVKLATVGAVSERASSEPAARAESKVEAPAEDKPAAAASSEGVGCVPAAAPPQSQPIAMQVDQAPPRVDVAHPAPRPHAGKATAQRAHHARHRHARLRRHRLVMQAQAQAQAAFALQQQQAQQASPFFGLPVTRTR